MLMTPITARATMVSQVLQYYGGTSYKFDQSLQAVNNVLNDSQNAGYQRRGQLVIQLLKAEEDIVKLGLPLSGVVSSQSDWQVIKAVLGFNPWKNGVAKMSDEALVKEAKKECSTVPDFVAVELLTRQQENPEPFIESLNHFANIDPLRLSSEEGVLYYLGVLHVADMSSLLLNKLLRAGDNDIRIVPFLKKLVGEYSYLFKQEHIPQFMKLLGPNLCVQTLALDLAERRRDLLRDIIINNVVMCFLFHSSDLFFYNWDKRW